ncbi:hypothetical protein HanLR1_Chr12g0449001 [Helianthus annuus]|nr:hypothetical protein HanLR1_Chr12g0449001 [Helianthus annuus]
MPPSLITCDQTHACMKTRTKKMNLEYEIVMELPESSLMHLRTPVDVLRIQQSSCLADLTNISAKGRFKLVYMRGTSQTGQNNWFICTEQVKRVKNHQNCVQNA